LLEVGGGTGGTTASSCPSPPRTGGVESNTDVSKRLPFLGRREVPRLPFLRDGLLDFEGLSPQQGKAAPGYDGSSRPTPCKGARAATSPMPSAGMRSLLRPGWSCCSTSDQPPSWSTARSARIEVCQRFETASGRRPYLNPPRNGVSPRPNLRDGRDLPPPVRPRKPRGPVLAARCPRAGLAGQPRRIASAGEGVGMACRASERTEPPPMWGGGWWGGVGGGGGGGPLPPPCGA